MPSKVAMAQANMSDLEDDLLNSELEHVESKPVINRSVIKKSTKTRPAPAKTATTKIVTAKKTATKTKAQREALKDRTNVAGSDTEDVDDFEDDPPAKPKPNKTKSAKAKEEEEEENTAPNKKARAPKVKAAAPRAAAEEEAPLPKARKQKVVKRAPSPERIIPETQPEPIEISQSIEDIQEDNMDIDVEPSPPLPQKFVQRDRSLSRQPQAQPTSFPPRAKSTSQQPRSLARERSASEAEWRAADSESKKKLSEMTRKYEDMKMKYESLQVLGRNAAESNFDKLKKASDQKAKNADDLIASLKKELSELRKTSSSAVSESARLQSQVASLQTKHEKLIEDGKTTHTTLLEAQNEVKSLTAKLDAARKSNAAPEKVPGSAMKSRDLGRSQMGNYPETAKHAVLKEELYRDLTGLIINSVKQKDGEDEYSCIQTGRNGTLHFHLTVNNDSAVTNPKTPSGLSYEETEFAYEPLLDDNRDRDLIDILPDYLAEEICFPRNHAVKFYTKVVESMTRKVVVEE